MPESIDAENIIRYYNDLLDLHVDESHAVGWSNAESQASKFYEVTQIFAHEKHPFSVYDVGCGLGHLHEFLAKTNPLARYYGCDINPKMVERAHQRNANLEVECRDILLSPPQERYDYVVASGTFNLRMNSSKAAWKHYVQQILAALYGITGRGMAIDFLSTFAQSEEPNEYHEDPSEILTFVQRNLSPLAEIRHSVSPGHFAVFAYRSFPLKRISRLRGPSLKSKSTIDIRGTKSP
jgi:SAM-dependent methyltransferase